MNNSLRYKAHQLIKDRIISLELKPGDELREGNLAKGMGMGRTPVREALLMLEQEKLVECRANVGYVVRKLTRKEAEDYYALREALEEFAAPLIIERITPELVKELEKILQKSEECLKRGDIKGIAANNTEFHSILYKATDSEAFMELILLVIDKIRWLLAIAVTYQKGPAEALADHRRMLRAIQNRSLSELKKEIRLHLQHAREKYFLMSEMLF
ncbi:MAG: GntR family transcriptional regulator [Deltaproteobacteria bacterium]|nr:GntR family transcriptional regulator [Deltaproteobacteria bacterium]